jgi:hypothetical protein
MSIPSTINENLTRMIDLSIRGYADSAVQLFNKCDLSDLSKEQKDKIHTILEETHSNSASEASLQMKESIVAVLVGKPITNNQIASPVKQLPEEIIFHIFSFFDLKGLGVIASVCKVFQRIQETGCFWRSLFPQIKSSHLELPEKERARIVKAEIRLGEEGKFNQCILNPLTKKITQLEHGSIDEMCILALQRPEVPNGSFVVYTHGGRQIPCAVIKNQEGVVVDVHDIRFPSDQNKKIIAKLRAEQGTPSEFHEFKFIVHSTIEMRGLISSNMERASKLLKGTTNDY